MLLFQDTKNKFNRIIELLVLSIPLLLITGPFLSDLALTIVAIFFLFMHKEYFKNEIIVKYFIFYFLIFYIVILASSLFAFDPMLSLKNSIFYFRFLLFSICFYYLLKRNSKMLNYLFYVLIFCFFILIFDGFFQAYFKFNIFGLQVNQEYFGGRISSFFGDELILGSYLTRFSPLLIGLSLFYYEKRKGFKLYLLFLIFLLEIIIFLSGERTAFLLFNLIIVLLLIFLNNTGNINKAILFSVPVIILILVLVESPSKKRIINETLKDLKPKDYNSKFVIINKQYHEHFISSYRIFLDNKLLGVGPKNFRNICHDERYKLSENTCSTHPHNTYLQLLSETGIFSFILIIILFIALNFLLFRHLYFKLFKKAAYLSNFQVCIIIHFFISLFPLTPTGSFFNNWLSIVYYYPLGILFWSLNNKKIT